jgi:tRNA (guanine37-N1)-methyltransferase
VFTIGDYVLTGGELPAKVVCDSVIRLLPGVLRAEATVEESFENGILEYPQYTKPSDWKGEKVPEVLLSGDHERIRAWREQEALRITRERRPDLLV